MRPLGGVVPGVILGVQIDAGRTQVDVPEVVADHLQIGALAQMIAGDVPPMSLKR